MAYNVSHFCISKLHGSYCLYSPEKYVYFDGTYGLTEEFLFVAYLVLDIFFIVKNEQVC